VRVRPTDLTKHGAQTLLSEPQAVTDVHTRELPLPVMHRLSFRCSFDPSCAGQSHPLCLSTQVFNVTPYLHFHPGGLKYIMMGAGRDATSLFNKYHAWVNIDFLMSQCLVGLVEAPSKAIAAASAEHGAADSESASKTGAAAPPAES